MSDTTIETTDTFETSDPSFTTELLKTVATSTAATAGTLAGFVLIGLSVDQVQKFRTRRAAKKAADNTASTES